MANPQPLAGRLGVVAAIEADARPLWEQPRSSRGIQGLAKQRRVVAVCGSAHYPERDASGVDRYRAFDASLSPLYRAPPGLLSPARRLCGATIDGYLREFEADGPVVGFERHPLNSPITPSSIHSSRRRLTNVVAEHESSAMRQ